jgi:DNA-binding NarL/FixJ family response regulator
MDSIYVCENNAKVSVMTTAVLDRKKILSKRETEIANLLAKGYSYKEICATLGIQIGTVQTHVVNVYRKLGARCRMDVVNLAIGASCSFLERGECPLAIRLKRRRIIHD